jgi:hypothetical protein
MGNHEKPWISFPRELAGKSSIILRAFAEYFLNEFSSLGPREWIKRPADSVSGLDQDAVLVTKANGKNIVIFN